MSIADMTKVLTAAQKVFKGGPSFFALSNGELELFVPHPKSKKEFVPLPFGEEDVNKYIKDLPWMRDILLHDDEIRKLAKRIRSKGFRDN